MRASTSPPVLLRLLTAMTLALAMLAVPALANDQPSPELEPKPGISETIEVRVINVEAVVTDRSGSRVFGLKPEDFRLSVDGMPIPIEYFSEIRGGELIESRAGSSRSFPGIEPGSPVSTKYLVFIDDYFSVERDRNRVLDQLEEELNLLRPVDRMAIVAFDGSKTEMLTSWTSDQAELRRALDEARQRKARGLERYSELRMSDEERELTRRAFTRFYDFQLSPLERHYAEKLSRQLRASVTAATAALQGFAAPQGRKVAMILSGGWPYSPAEYTVATYFATFEDVTRASLDPSIRGRAELYDGLTDTANLLGYTLYTVDVPGLDPLDNVGLDASRSVAPNRTAAFDREQQTEHTLTFLANETGGRALLNGERLDAFSEVVNDTRSHYWLGFSARRVEDGKRHDIDVEVAESGLRVRTRRDFVDLTRDRELDLMVQSALMFGQPPAEQLLELRLGKTESTGSKRLQLPIDVGIPMEKIFLENRGGRYVGQLEVRIAAMGPDGEMSKIATQRVEIDEDRAPKPDEQFWFETTLELRKTTDRLVIVVFDPMTGNAMTALESVDFAS